MLNESSLHLHLGIVYLAKCTEGYLPTETDETKGLEWKSIAELKEMAIENIPDNFDYRKIKGLSVEVLQKLEKYRPCTVAQVLQISGITPAAISLLLIFLKK